MLFISKAFLIEDFGLTLAMTVIMFVLYCMVFVLMGTDRLGKAGLLMLFTLSINWWLVESTMLTGY